MITDAAAAEGLSPTQARTIMLTIDRPTLAGMIAWLNDAANQGADEAAWRQAWPGPLVSATDPQTRFVMRVVADLGDGQVI